MINVEQANIDLINQLAARSDVKKFLLIMVGKLN